MKELIEKCIKSAIDYGVVSYEVIVNSRKTNRHYKEKRKYFQELKALPNGILGLMNLLNHEHPYVRYTAAIYLLSVDEHMAKNEIEKLKGISKHLDFSIKYLLQEWDKGNLREYYK